MNTNTNHYERAMTLLEAAQGTKVESIARVLTEQASVCALLAIGATLVTMNKKLDAIDTTLFAAVPK